MSKNMSDNVSSNDEGIWPPPIHYREEAEVQPLSAMAELTPQERVIVAGRWLFTLAITWNLVAFIWEGIDHVLHMTHILHWGHLFILTLVPITVKSWRLKLKR